MIHVVAIGLTEHIGYKKLQGFMQTVAAAWMMMVCFFILIGPFPFKTAIVSINKYIFPNCLGAFQPKQLTAAMEGVFKSRDLHNFGTYYTINSCCMV